jgi:hypothetical protein
MLANTLPSILRRADSVRPPRPPSNRTPLVGQLTRLKCRAKVGTIADSVRIPGGRAAGAASDVLGLAHWPGTLGACSCLTVQRRNSSNKASRRP